MKYSKNIQEKIEIRPRLVTLSISLLMAVAMIACGGGSTGVNGGNGGNGGGNGEEEPGPNEVWMVGQAFAPSDREVEVGTTITWTNQSSEVHTVTSDDGIFDSGNISSGGTFSYTFEDAGEYSYFCQPHPHMTGTITVVE